MFPTSHLFALGLLASCVAGCTGSPHEYSIRVKDPRAVTVAEIPTPLSPADGAPAVASGMHHDEPWALVIFREANGTLRLRCAACNRDAFLVGTDGVMHVFSSASPAELGLLRPAPAEPAREATLGLEYHYCGYPSRRGCAGGEWTGMRVTPWSNVAEVRVRSGTSAASSPLVFVAGLGTTALGTVFTVAGLRSDHPAEQVLGTAGGLGLVALGAFFIKLFIDGNSEHVLSRPEER